MFNFDCQDERYKVYNRGRLVTKPDEALTPRQVLLRYSTGNLEGIKVNDLYYDLPLGSGAALSLDSTISHRRAISTFLSKETKKLESELLKQAVAERKAEEERERTRSRGQTSDDEK